MEHSRHPLPDCPFDKPVVLLTVFDHYKSTACDKKHWEELFDSHCRPPQQQRSPASPSASLPAHKLCIQAPSDLPPQLIYKPIDFHQVSKTYMSLNTSGIRILYGLPSKKAIDKKQRGSERTTNTQPRYFTSHILVAASQDMVKW